jgi:hypothetical protein
MRGPRRWLIHAVLAFPVAATAHARQDGPVLPEEPPLPVLTPTPNAPPLNLPPAPRDPLVRPTSDLVPDRVPGRAEQLESLRLDPGKEAAQVAARVGDTIITVRELKRAIRDRLGPQTQWNQLSREDKDTLGRGVLDSLVDRAVILQAARKKFDKPKQWETFREYFETAWNDQELPKLMRRYKCENEVALRLALEKLNDSLAERREIYLQEQMARAFVSEMIRAKVPTTLGVRPLYAYYRANISRFERPAEVTWREIRVSAEKFPDPAARRAHAEEARARLARGEDFAAVARRYSDSPRAAEGGLWKTTPGGFAAVAVNDALERLAPGQVSELIEDPSAIYIVRVDHRRPAGPAPFEEVQSQIAEVLQGQAFEKALDRYLRDLRATIPVSYPLFEGSSAAPYPAR